MNTVIIPAAGINFDEVSSVPSQTLGLIAQASDGGFYQYIKSGAAMTKGLAYAISKAFVGGATAATTTSLGSAPTALGVPQHANFTAADQYGWVFVGPGPFSVHTAAAASANVKLYSSATAGKVDDDSSGTVLLPGAYLTAAATGAALSSGFANSRLTAN